jgi:CDP-2,3-bis-(O-geranylgeranyl)-sn-glycerol synthase
MRPVDMSPHLIVELLILLLLANGMPVVAARLLGGRWDAPVDGRRTAWDGRRWLGPSKTVRGFVVAVLTVAPAAMAFGHSVWLGVLFAIASLIGDALSSFIKRRLDIEPSGRATGLDQIPEALLPLLVCYPLLGLTPAVVVVVVVLFVAGQALMSPLMYRLGIRHRPY